MVKTSRKLGEYRSQVTWLGQVKWSVLHRQEPACWDHLLVGFNIAIRRNLNHMIEDAASGMSFQVEVAVIRQTDGRRPSCSGAVFAAQLVLIGKHVAGRAAEMTGIALLAILTFVFEANATQGCSSDHRCAPNDLVESSAAAVKVVGSFIASQRVSETIKGKAGVADAVGKAPDGGTEVWRVRDIVAGRIETENNVRAFPARVRNRERHQDGAVREDLGFQLVIVPETEQVHAILERGVWVPAADHVALPPTKLHTMPAAVLRQGTARVPDGDAKACEPHVSSREGAAANWTLILRETHKKGR